MSKKLFWLLPLVFFLGLAVVLWRQLGVDPQIVPQQTTGHMLPAMKLKSLVDPAQIITLEKMPKQPFVLNVWGSWCPTCAKEVPYLMSLKQKGVMIVGVDYKDTPENALNFLADKGNPYLINVQDDDGQYGIDLGVTGAPESFVIDRQHHIQKHIVGEVDEAVWHEELEPCLQKLSQGGQCT